MKKYFPYILFLLCTWNFSLPAQITFQKVIKPAASYPANAIAYDVTGNGTGGFAAAGVMIPAPGSQTDIWVMNMDGNGKFDSTNA
jgi:hypothetical protein